MSHLAISHDIDAAGVYRRLLGYVRPHWRAFAVALVAMIVAAATQPAFAALMKPLLDEGFVAKNSAAVAWYPLLIVALFLLRGIAEFISNYGMQWIGRQVVKKLRQDLFEHLLHMPAAVYDRSTSGALLAKVTYHVEQVAESTTNAITVLVRDSMAVIGLVAWMFWLNPLLSLYLAVIGPVIVVLVRYVSRRFRNVSARIQTSVGDVTQVAEEAIAGQRVVKIFGGQEHEARRFDAANERNRRLHMKMAATRAGSSPVVQLIASLGLAGIVYVATHENVLEAVTVGTFVSFLGAMLLLTNPLKHLTEVNAPLQRGIAAGAAIFALLDEPRESTGGNVPLERARGDIEYDRVHFTYDPQKGEVLKGVSFRIAAGRTVAFVGRSGSGKSTLVNLLPRFYDPTSGTIRLDGRDIREYRLADLRNQIALVSQEVLLFNDTIANNIAYGRLGGAGREQIEAAAEAANAMEFIRRLPHGLDTRVGDRGILLSGGQRQRIAIARALLKDAPILILDEATSALDTESERYIQAALERLMASRTTLVIAHRLSTVENADLLVVLDGGTVIESGTHHELLARDGAYAALYRMQFREPVEV